MSCLQRRSILQPLVRPLSVIVLDELAHEVVEVLRPLCHEVIEALLLQCPDGPLGVGGEEDPRSETLQAAHVRMVRTADPTGSLTRAALMIRACPRSPLSATADLRADARGSEGRAALLRAGCDGAVLMALL